MKMLIRSTTKLKHVKNLNYEKINKIWIISSEEANHINLDQNELDT